MKKILTILLLSLCTAMHGQDTTESDSTNLQTDSIAWTEVLRMRLDSITQAASMLQTSQMGFMVYDLTADSVLYTLNHRQTLRPASTMKLLTAVTALDALGGEYTFRTTLRTTGEISEGKLLGDLYCIGGMDPKVSQDDLHAMAYALREAGIDTICGSLYADRSMRDDIVYGEGWCWDDKNPMLVALPYQRLDNFMDNLIQVMQADSIVILNPAHSARNCVAGARTVFTLSHTIDEILRPTLKNSNNMYAECLYYQIGLTRGKPSTAKKAKAVEEALLKKLGLADRPHRFADGSGLSLYNYVSAEMEVAFLRYAYRDSTIFAHLYPALPIAGVDGTIGERMTGTAAHGNVHAKTGTLSGISSLSGYCTAPDGHLLCFAIINQGVMRTAVAKALQDKLCVAMTSEEGK